MCPLPPLRAQIAAVAAGPLGRCARAGRKSHGLSGDRAGVTSIEYALMGALVSLAIIGGVAGYSGSLGAMMSATFTKIATAM